MFQVVGMARSPPFTLVSYRRATAVQQAATDSGSCTPSAAVPPTTESTPFATSQDDQDPPSRAAGHRAFATATFATPPPFRSRRSSSMSANASANSLSPSSSSPPLSGASQSDGHHIHGPVVGVVAPHNVDQRGRMRGSNRKRRRPQPQPQPHQPQHQMRHDQHPQVWPDPHQRPHADDKSEDGDDDDAEEAEEEPMGLDPHPHPHPHDPHDPHERPQVVDPRAVDGHQALMDELFWQKKHEAELAFPRTLAILFLFFCHVTPGDVGRATCERLEECVHLSFDRRLRGQQPPRRAQQQQEREQRRLNLSLWRQLWNSVWPPTPTPSPSASMRPRRSTTTSTASSASSASSSSSSSLASPSARSATSLWSQCEAQPRDEANPMPLPKFLGVCCDLWLWTVEILADERLLPIALTDCGQGDTAPAAYPLSKRGFRHLYLQRMETLDSLLHQKLAEFSVRDPPLTLAVLLDQLIAVVYVHDQFRALRPTLRTLLSARSAFGLELLVAQHREVYMVRLVPVTLSLCM